MFVYGKEEQAAKGPAMQEEDLSSDPSTHPQRQTGWFMPDIPGLGNTQDSEELWLGSPAKSVSSRFHERPCHSYSPPPE